MSKDIQKAREEMPSPRHQDLDHVGDPPPQYQKIAAWYETHHETIHTLLDRAIQEQGAVGEDEGVVSKMISLFKQYEEPQTTAMLMLGAVFLLMEKQFHKDDLPDLINGAMKKSGWTK